LSSAKSDMADYETRVRLNQATIDFIHFQICSCEEDHEDERGSAEIATVFAKAPPDDAGYLK